MKSQKVNNIEFRKIAREVKKLPLSARKLQLLFWYKKGERSARLLQCMRELQDQY